MTAMVKGTTIQYSPETGRCPRCMAIAEGPRGQRQRLKCYTCAACGTYYRRLPARTMAILLLLPGVVIINAVAACFPRSLGLALMLSWVYVSLLAGPCQTIARSGKPRPE